MSTVLSPPSAPSWRDITCPVATCQAPPGKSCRTPSGGYRNQAHVERMGRPSRAWKKKGQLDGTGFGRRG